MAGRTAGVAFAIAVGVIGTVVVALPRVVIAAEECLTEPTGEKSDAQRWYYRFDRGTNRRCWYLKDANGSNTAALARPAQQPAPWDFAQPAPPKLTTRRTDGPAPRAAADALAEAPQPRLRTDLAVRGTPKPQNVAITPTTLTASDASLPRGLDSASPWPSAPPPQQQAETASGDSTSAAMADDGNADMANTTPAFDGQGANISKTAKPEAPIHMLMLVVIGALAISGLLASALYRLSRMGRRRRGNRSWHADAARNRRSRTQPRTKASPAGSRADRGGMPPAPSHAGNSRGAQPASALDLASARLASAQPEPVEPRGYHPGPAHQHGHHQAVSARRRELDAASDMQRSQNTDAVWQAADQLAEHAAARRAPPTAPDHIAAAAQPSSTAPMPAASQAQQAQTAAAQIAAAQMALAQAAAAKAKMTAAQTNAVAPPASPGHAAWSEPTANETWPAQRTAAQAPAFVAPNSSPAAPLPQPVQPAAAAEPPAPVDVSEIVTALRKARAGEAASPSAGAAPLDAAKVIAALLVSRAAKRRNTQPATETGEAPHAVPGPALAVSQPMAEAAAPQPAQAPQQMMPQLRSAQPIAQPDFAMSQQTTGVSAQPAAADPAAALIETLRAHAARQPTYQADERVGAAEPEAVSDESRATAEEDELDDPAAALINLLQSRFSLPEDELEPEQPPEEELAAFAAEAPHNVAHLHDDPAAQLMSLLESRSSIPAAVPPAAVEQPRQRPQQAPQQQPQRTPQQRPLFAPTPMEDSATPPLDFIPRPPALRPRPRNIQQDESLDGIQDILARLGRRA
ncbi:conserved exported protein of unknown function [Bradyrhizobium sp. ORS 285]|uniref:hypothetical protein n=1 Tax=Bradyrhizobium sp. ORS 285 TaxID=115808 RepID=UPI0002408FAD|nr:hypothetical protein [Bradyrhizobium sp. ORS 285]CCD88086.1 conserved exported hypothetical protein [Bradyrhizobium sp. ORS 285]SMX58928.1 conserved exported protein of unknown function [Bradyrhizobium sp. ORS 285]